MKYRYNPNFAQRRNSFERLYYFSVTFEDALNHFDSIDVPRWQLFILKQGEINSD